MTRTYTPRLVCRYCEDVVVELIGLPVFEVFGERGVNLVGQRVTSKS